MKKLLLTSALFIALISTSFAAGTEALSFNGANAFKKSFPGATNISVKNMDELTKISFTSNNENYEVFYSDNGDMVAQSKHIKLEALPKNTLATLQQKYADWATTEAIEFVNESDGATLYYVSIQKDGKRMIFEATSDGATRIYKK